MLYCYFPCEWKPHVKFVLQTKLTAFLDKTTAYFHAIYILTIFHLKPQIEHTLQALFYLHFYAWGSRNAWVL